MRAFFVSGTIDGPRIGGSGFFREEHLSLSANFAVSETPALLDWATLSRSAGAMALPSLSGGPVSKVADLYEAAWTANSLLDLLAGDSDELHLEPQGEDGLGVEFYQVQRSGEREYHSVKRQAPSTSGAWTPSQLVVNSPISGRSILGDLFEHLGRSATARAVFVSQDGARHMRELAERARAASSLEAFRPLLSGELKAAFDKQVTPLAQDETDAYQKLRQSEFRTVGHNELVRFVEQRVPALVQRADGKPAEPHDVRLLLSNFAWNRLGQTVTPADVVNELQVRGFSEQPLAMSAQVRGQVKERNEAYLHRVQKTLINGAYIPRSQAAAIVEELRDGGQSLLLAGSAGEGKTCVVAQVLKTLHDAGIPHLALSMDELEGIVSSADLGERLGLPASPAIVLGQMSGDNRAVLCIDQLDALSFVSGRNVQGREVLEELVLQASRYPQLRILLACRSFDLDRDASLSGLVNGESPTARRINVEELSVEDVQTSLAAAGITELALSESQVKLLRTPLHLYLLLGGGTTRSSFGSRRDLFERYWDEKRQRVDEFTQAGAFVKAVDRLSDLLSARRQLQAPRLALAGHEAALDAMASEGVVVIEGSQAAFSHASFFDYAFARGFIGRGEELVGWLQTDGQDLFRRSQTRQVLEFLRDDGPKVYLETLSHLLADESVRFHLKRLALDWLGQLADPREGEWQVLTEQDEQLDSHVIGSIRNNVHWFDLLNRLGVLGGWLTSEREEDRSKALFLLRMPEVLRDRSPSVASLLRTLMGGSEADKQSLLAVMSRGAAYHSREMMDLFLELVRDGTLDEARGFAMNDDWWSVLYEMSTEKPGYCSEAIGHWLDRQCELAAQTAWWSQSSEHVISSSASGAPLAFARELLPRIARAAGGPDSAAWEHALIGVKDEVTEALSGALRRLALEDPGGLDDLVASLPAVPLPNIEIDTLKMDAWASNPSRYADRILKLLIERDELLDAPGAGRAVSAGTGAGKRDLCASVEQLLLKHAPEDERGRWYGYSQYRLLSHFKAGAVSAQGTRRLEELRRKFGDESPSDRPLVIRGTAGSVPPRIPDDATELMSDEEWLHAMRTLRRRRNSGSEDLDWDQVTLSRQLEAQTKKDPERFASLAADLMTNDIPPLYFAAVLDGLACREQENLRLEGIIKVVRRLHQLANRPCGLAIVRAVKTIASSDVPPDVIGAVAFYATEDPDPHGDEWFTNLARDAGPSELLALTAGINSVRGAAAETVAALLFADTDRTALLRSAVEALVRDPTLTVRTLAPLPLLAILHDDEPESLDLFDVLCADADPILGTRYFELYLNHAVYRSYEAVRSTLLRMVVSEEADVRRAAARQICLAALHDGGFQKAAIEDAARVENGDPEMRLGAAGIYARSCGQVDVASQCLQKLPRFFADSAAEVRMEAAHCFSYIQPEKILEHDALIEAFSASAAFADRASALLRLLESMSSPLPGSVCSLADRAVDAWGEAAGDISTSAAGDAYILSKLVVRFYAQASDDAQGGRALDAIDRMIEVDFSGLQDELSAADRG